MTDPEKISREALEAARSAGGAMRVDEEGSEGASADEIEIPPELRQCGAVIDKAIEYLVEKGFPTELIASALLGGSLGVLARTTDAETMMNMLYTAIEGIRAGDLLRDDAMQEEV